MVMNSLSTVSINIVLLHIEDSNRIPSVVQVGLGRLVSAGHRSSATV